MHYLEHDGREMSGLFPAQRPSGSAKLSDWFENARAASVMWRGLLVHSMYELPAVTAGTMFRITFDDQNPARPEGLRVKVRGGTIRIAGQDLDDAVLWSDSAPRLVEAHVQSNSDSVNVRFWNCWRDTADTVHAWIGNAGMIVDEMESGFRLRCSDGLGEATFDDLVALVELSSP